MEPRLKFVVIGDGAVGKTCMLISYSQNKFPTEYVPTIFDAYVFNLTINGQIYTVGLFDTAGQEDYDCLRPLAYPDTDVFLVCFSILSQTSLANAQVKWVPEVQKYYPKTPYLLVGTQTDLRDDPETLNKLNREHQKPITKLQGEKVAKTVGAAMYVECSALTQNGLKNVFDQAVIIALSPQYKKKKQQQQQQQKQQKASSHRDRCALL